MKRLIWLILALLVLSLTANYMQCTKQQERADTVVLERTDTQYVTIRDTMPVPKVVRITDSVTIRLRDTIIKRDSIILPVVQKIYNDSSYTAYVSGLQYGSLPKLDSISVQERIITREIERTITRERKRAITYGVQTGAGIGMFSRQPDIYVGFGLQYNF